MDDEIPLQGGSHASSSHEVSLEPTTKRREDLGKHNVHTHFPKDRNCEICERTKITRAPCRRRNGEAVPRVVNFGAGKGENSLQHYNLVHKFIPMPQAMKIPAAKAAVDKEWEKLEKISTWNLTKVKSKKKVIDEARVSGTAVHFASFMDICHLKKC